MNNFLEKLNKAIKLINEVKQDRIEKSECTDLLTFTSLLLQTYDSKKAVNKADIQKMLDNFFE